jgi:hypothetical protein
MALDPWALMPWRRCFHAGGQLETGHQEHCTDCQGEMPVRFEPQESHAAAWWLKRVANRPAGR